ncbi:YceI family protein [Sessilibacter sp. MAH1]
MIHTTKKFAKMFTVAGLGAAALLSASLASAEMSLDKGLSQLTFLTTKNSAVTEAHTFKNIVGTISDDGKVTVDIDLTSVDTAIAIRDERMQNILFETAKFATATFTADVSAVLAEVNQKSIAKATVEGELSLHGKTVPVTFDVLANEMETGVVVSTLKPTMIKADQFDLLAGVQQLQEIAKLNSITPVVPTSFVLTFKN